jgi:hypothetical protein
MPPYSKYHLQTDESYSGPVYSGPLIPDRMTAEQRRASKIYCGMVNRCYCESSKTYKSYGAKGIRILFSKRQFIGWWCKNLKTFKGSLPTTGRVDHSLHYSFDNIFMQENSENTLEMLGRCGTPTPPRAVAVLNAETLEVLYLCESLHEAERRTGICFQNIYKYCKGTYPYYKRTRSGLTFRYAECS